VIVGGGSAGITVASRLFRNLSDPDVLIIEPSEDHFYQPMWTLNGAGIGSAGATRKDQADVTPTGADWLQDAVRTVDLEEQSVTTENGDTIRYEYLVLAPGIQLDWDAIPGLKGNVGKYGICSNYAYDTVRTTEETLSTFESGTALFTMPATPVKCPGAPQKIVYLADEVLRKNEVRDQSEIIFSLPGDDIFGIEKYAEPLRRVIDRKDIDPRYGTRLDALEPEGQQAVIEDPESGETTTIDYDMIHVTLPQSAPDFLETSGLTDENGWIDVDKHTLQHSEYDNVFALGDVSSLPTSKTAAAVRKQAPVLVRNLRWLHRLSAGNRIRFGCHGRARLRREPSGDLPLRPGEGTTDYVLGKALPASALLLVPDAERTKVSGRSVRIGSRSTTS
jgi:sulfide:quinone oxidoreductase